MGNSIFATAGPIRSTAADVGRYDGRSARSMLSRIEYDDAGMPTFRRVAEHITADPQRVGEWLAPSVEQWHAAAGPLVAQNAVVMLEWTGTGIPVIPVVNEGFAVALQAAQKTELATRSAIVDDGGDPVTIGGYANVSRQMLDFQDRSADVVFGLFDVAAAVGLDVWMADRLDAAASTGHADLDAALDSFPRDGMYSPLVVAAPPSYVTANGDALRALADAGLRIVADHRLVRPLVLDPLAAVFVASTAEIDTVDEPAVLGVQVGVRRYVSAGISSAGVAAIG